MQPNVYAFHKAIDQGYLKEFYADDIDRMVLMFGVFLKVLDNEISKLEEYRNSGDWRAFAAQAHKIKPNFLMVGLRSLSEKMRRFEGAKQDESIREEVQQDFDVLKREISQSKTIVEKELKRLQKINMV